MLITVKNLQQQTFTVKFEPGKTVLELKETIYRERGPEYVVEKQKLIYAGVILDDLRTIASYNVDEKKFVVVMLKRDLGGGLPKPDESGVASTSDANAASSILNSADTTISAKIKSSNTDVPMTGDTTTFEGKSGSDEDTKSIDSGGSDGSGGGVSTDILGRVTSNTSILSNTSGASLLSSSSFGSGGSETSHSTYSSGDLAGVFSNTSLQSRAESNLLMGDEYNRSVESMVEMGYSREMVERAMAASFNNPERAVEYLISGIPETEDGFIASSAVVGENVLLGGGAVAGNVNLSSGNVRTSSVRDDGVSNDGNVHISTAGDGSTNQRLWSATGDGGGDGSNRRLGDTAFDGDGASIVVGPAGDELNNAQQNVEGSNDATGERGVAAREGDPFEFLRNQPQFLQMRSLVYQNPDLLHAVLDQIGQTNPALLQLISENQDAFLSMLNQPMPNRRMTPGRRAQLAAAARASAGGDGPHVRALDTAPGAGGDGPQIQQRPGESGDAGADTISHEHLAPRPDRAAERRAAATDAFMRERAAAAAAVAELTAAASAAVDRDAIVGQGANPVDHSSLGGFVGAELGEGLNTIRLTTRDQDAIERLKALGFPEALVLQAYFACDKDEQLAANFLISSAFDD